MSTKFLTIQEVSKRLGRSRSQVRRMCETGKLPGATKTGKSWEIPTTADIRLCKRPVNLSQVDIEALRNVPANKRKDACERVGLLYQMEKFVSDLVQNGMYCKEAMKGFAKTQGMSYQTLYRWRKRYREEGVLGLVDTRGGNNEDYVSMSPEAFKQFKEYYLTQKRLPVKLCLEMIRIYGRDNNMDWALPRNLQTMYNLIKRDIPKYVQVLHREGMAAYEAKCAPYIVKDPDSIEPGEYWIGDHHQCNAWIRYCNKWVRPWITAWEDMRSRMIVGHEISVSPNQTTVLLATKRGVEKFGPPEMVKIDNGKDYDSEMWTGTTKVKRRKYIKRGFMDEKEVAGIYALMDVGVSFSIPYHPQSKPIERFFDTLDRQFTKTMATYCGKNTGQKPDYLNDLLTSDKAIREGLSLEEFRDKVNDYIENVYNQTGHTGAGMDGRSPAEVMESRQSRRVMKDGVSDLLMRVWKNGLTIGKNGVKFNGTWYGQYDPVLMDNQGKKVRVSYDPGDISQVYVHDAESYRLLAVVEQAKLVRYGVDEEAMREGMRSKARIAKVAKEYRDSRRTAYMEVTDLAIEAMRKREEKPAKEGPAKAIKPVKTLLDNQVELGKNLVTSKKLKKAAGAEGSAELDLGIDFSLPRKKNKEVETFKLFY